MDLMMPPPPPHQTPGAPSSPEFEFWVTRNPSLPPSHLLSADELFAGGVMLPLHLLHPSDEPDPATKAEAAPRPVENGETAGESTADSSPAITSSAPASGSKRWMDIFRGISGERKPAAAVEEKPAAVSVEKSRRRERKMSAGGAAELNINIWPFSRSRSAGNSAGGGFRQKSSSSAAAGRKASSAPCSRSNSRGESSRPPTPGSRKCPSSPGRNRMEGGGGGVYVGRSIPVCHVKRSGTKKVVEAGEGFTAAGGGGGKKGGIDGRSGGGLGLSVNNCIDHRQGNCRGENKEAENGGERTVGGGGGGGGNGIHHHHFNLRALFSKKVY